MLSLDISGAFPNTTHAGLIWLLKEKGFPNWIIRFVESFLKDRKTKLAFDGYESEWRRMETGMPQGSPMSPILFLIYITDLLKELQDPETGTLGFGFVDDTSLVAWGGSAAENCRKLTYIHDKCIAWAKRFGAKFAPDKYQLIHFHTKAKGSEWRFEKHSEYPWP